MWSFIFIPKKKDEPLQKASVEASSVSADLQTLEPSFSLFSSGQT